MWTPFNSRSRYLAGWWTDKPTVSTSNLQTPANLNNIFRVFHTLQVNSGTARRWGHDFLTRSSYNSQTSYGLTQQHCRKEIRNFRKIQKNYVDCILLSDKILLSAHQIDLGEDSANKSRITCFFPEKRHT